MSKSGAARSSRNVRSLDHAYYPGLSAVAIQIWFWVFFYFNAFICNAYIPATLTLAPIAIIHTLTNYKKDFKNAKENMSEIILTTCLVPIWTATITAAIAVYFGAAISKIDVTRIDRFAASAACRISSIACYLSAGYWLVFTINESKELMSPIYIGTAIYYIAKYMSDLYAQKYYLKNYDLNFQADQAGTIFRCSLARMTMQQKPKFWLKVLGYVIVNVIKAPFVAFYWVYCKVVCFIVRDVPEILMKEYILKSSEERNSCVFNPSLRSFLAKVVVRASAYQCVGAPLIGVKSLSTLDGKINYVYLKKYDTIQKKWLVYRKFNTIESMEELERVSGFNRFIALGKQLYTNERLNVLCNANNVLVVYCLGMLTGGGKPGFLKGKSTPRRSRSGANEKSSKYAPFGLRTPKEKTDDDDSIASDGDLRTLREADEQSAREELDGSTLKESGVPAPTVSAREELEGSTLKESGVPAPTVEMLEKAKRVLSRKLLKAKRTLPAKEELNVANPVQVKPVQGDTAQGELKVTNPVQVTPVQGGTAQQGRRAEDSPPTEYYDFDEQARKERLQREIDNANPLPPPPVATKAKEDGNGRSGSVFGASVFSGSLFGVPPTVPEYGAYKSDHGDDEYGRPSFPYTPDSEKEADMEKVPYVTPDDSVSRAGSKSSKGSRSSRISSSVAKHLAPVNEMISTLLNEVKALKAAQSEKPHIGESTEPRKNEVEKTHIGESTEPRKTGVEFTKPEEIKKSLKAMRQSMCEKHEEETGEGSAVKVQHARRQMIAEPPLFPVKNFQKRVNAPFPSIPTSLPKENHLADRLLALEGWRKSIKAWCAGTTGAESELWSVIEVSLVDYLENHLIRSGSTDGILFDYSKIYVPEWAHARYAEWTAMTEFQVRASLSENENLLKRADNGWIEELDMSFTGNKSKRRSMDILPLTVIVAYIATVHLEYGLKNREQVKQLVSWVQYPERAISKAHGRDFSSTFAKLCVLKAVYDDHFPNGDGHETYHFATFSFSERLTGARELMDFLTKATGLFTAIELQDLLDKARAWHIYDPRCTEEALDAFYSYFQLTICRLPSVGKWVNPKPAPVAAYTFRKGDAKGGKGDQKGGKGDQKGGKGDSKGKGKGKGEIIEEDGKKFFVTKSGEKKEIGVCWPCKNANKVCPNKDTEPRVYCKPEPRGKGGA